MNRMIACIAAVALAAPALAADVMAAFYGNTAEVSFESGVTVSWYFDEGGAFSSADGASGSWTIDGETLCVTVGDADAQCTTIVGGAPSVGTPFTFSSEAGDAEVTIVEGRS